MVRETRILESLSTAVLVLDAHLRVVFLNPAGEMLFERSARRSIGVPLSEWMDNARLIVRMARAVNENRSFTERELELVLENNRKVTVDVTVTPQSDPGHPPGLLVEMIQVDRHLRITREENLIEQNLAVRQLVRGMAHEIKNPLGGLRGAAQLLERELESPELKEYTNIIIDEADRLRSLVNRMLGPNNVPQFKPTNIHHVLEHVRNLVNIEVPEGIEVQRDYDPSIPDFNADADMLIQATLNIVRNAVQALDGKGTIILRTRTQRQFTIGQKRHKLVVRVDIIDDGPGVPKEMMESIFYPMVTGHADGTGLGLAISQSLVNLHGGLIECTSEPGETMFTILLPIEAAGETINE